MVPTAADEAVHGREHDPPDHENTDEIQLV